MKPEIAALVGSRICHDLISPIGAIGNGVELLSLTGGGDSAEMSLISESVAHASARIRFFRIAFGSAGGGHPVGRSEVVSVLTAVGDGGRVRYDWQVAEDLPRAEVRLAFLMLLCLETAMPLGGTVTAQREGETWQITARADRLDRNAELWSLLDGRETAEAPLASQVQFALVPDAARALGRKIAVSEGAGTLTITA